MLSKLKTCKMISEAYTIQEGCHNHVFSSKQNNRDSPFHFGLPHPDPHAASALAMVSGGSDSCWGGKTPVRQPSSRTGCHAGAWAAAGGRRAAGGGGGGGRRAAAAAAVQCSAAVTRGSYRDFDPPPSAAASSVRCRPPPLFGSLRSAQLPMWSPEAATGALRRKSPCKKGSACTKIEC